MSTKKHSPHSASGAFRWMRCPASVRMSEGIQSVSSAYAEEGTAAAELAEITLRAGNNCEDHIGKQSKEAPGWEFSEEMARYVQVYVDYVRALGGDLMIEFKVTYAHIVAGGSGTADAIVLVGDTLHVIDLKYGTGLRVSAVENEQEQLYASGALANLDPFGEVIRRIVLHIVQPRLDHISEWETTPEELAAFEQRAREAAELSLSEDPPFNPGESQCRWCPAQTNCGALAQYNKETCLAAFDEPYGDFKEQNELSGEDLVWALERSKALTDWVSALQAEAVSRLMSGKAVPGYKVVEGRRLRQWKDKREAEVVLVGELGEEAYKPKEIITPAQAEKSLGKAKSKTLVAPLIETPQGNPTLAPVSDKRPSLRMSAQEVF